MIWQVIERNKKGRNVVLYTAEQNQIYFYSASITALKP